MRANAASSSVRHGKRRLLESCAIAAGIAALAYGGPALAQVAANPVPVSVGAGSGVASNSGTKTTTVTVTGAQSIYNWVPTDTAATGGDINVLPADSTWNFVGNGNYVVLNRFVNGAGGSLSRQIALNGTINSSNSAASGAQGGGIWFYNAGGILIGSTGVINVGSLVLTTNDIVTTGGLIDPATGIRFRGTSGSTAAITVNGTINASESFAPGSSYVALVAPRIVQNGLVSVDGSAAYVAAEEANIRINAGLFDINVLTGTTGGQAITHTGVTTGPEQQATGPAQGIYMVAIPKNTAVSMLVSGVVGFQDAVSATANGDGSIVLSAGYNVTNGTINATPVNATAANITINDTIFSSDVTAHASGALLARPLQDIPPPPPPSSLPPPDPTGRLVVQGNANFIGDTSATVAIDAGRTAFVTGNLTVQSGGSATTPGSAAINVNGGLLGVQGNTSIIAPAFFDTATGDTQGGNASLSITGGGQFNATGNVEVSADAFGGVDAAGKASGDGRGGSATITVSGANATGTASTLSGSGNIYAHANGYGAFPSSGFDNADTGGAGFGGSATIRVQNGGSLSTTAGLSAESNGQGGFGLVQAGDGTGGTALIEVTGTGSTLQAGSTALSATGTGGGGYSFDPVTGDTLPTLNGGDGVGGSATLRFNTGSTGTISTGFTDLNVSAFGGNAGEFFVPSGENATGGNATGGTATVETLGGTSATMASLAVNASGESGDASDSGTTARSGDGTGGTIDLSVTGAGSALILTGGDILLNASGIASSGSRKNAGSGTGGNISVSATDGGAISGVANLAANAFGGSSNISSLVSAGSGTGGTIDILADTGGTIAAQGYQALAMASVVNTDGNNGDARGGSVTIIARGGGNIATTSDGFTELNVGAIDGVSADGSTATGGDIQLIADGGRITLANTSFDASATSGSDGMGSASLATGGTITFRTGVDSDSLISAFSLNAAADAYARANYDGFVETPGDAQGGTVIVDVQGGALQTSGSFGMILSANGNGGTGDEGRGGNVSFTQTGGDVDVGNVTLSADGQGGTESGSGVGGSARLSLSGGSFTSGSVAVRAVGTGGQGLAGNDDPDFGVDAGIGGMGQGGTATIDIDGTAVVNTNGLSAFAIGNGGQGGDFYTYGNGSGVGGTGGVGTGGTATVNLIAGSVTADIVAADAGGAGGIGGSIFKSFSGGPSVGLGVGGAGGDGAGGAATLNLGATTLTLGEGGLSARAIGLGGDGGYGTDGGNGGNGIGGLAQAIVDDHDAGTLRLALDSTATGGTGGTGGNGNGGNGGFGQGGSSRVEANGPNAAIIVSQANFLTGGTGGTGGSAFTDSFGTPAVGGRGGDGGAGYGGTIEIVANGGATIALSGDFSSIGTGGNGGRGADNPNTIILPGPDGIVDTADDVTQGLIGGDGGTGGAGVGGTVHLLADGGTITSNGAPLTVTVGGVSGAGGDGGVGSGGTGGVGSTVIDQGGRVVFEALANASNAGRISLGDTVIHANGGFAGRIEMHTDGTISMASLDAEALGLANPTNNDTDVAPAGIFLAATGGSIATTGDMTLRTNSSVGAYAQAGGQVRAGGNLTIAADDQVDLRHEFRGGAANPTLFAAGDLSIAAGSGISGAPGTLLSAGNILTLRTTTVNANIGVDRLAGNDIVIDTAGRAEVEHAEAVNDFTATVGSFRTGLNSLITGGDIDIAAVGAVDLGNSTAGGFIAVNAGSIGFNALDAGTNVNLNATGTAVGASGINGGQITAGGDVTLYGDPAAAMLTIGSVNAGGFVEARGGALAFGNMVAGTDAILSSFNGALSVGDVTAGDDIFLTVNGSNANPNTISPDSQVGQVSSTRFALTTGNLRSTGLGSDTAASGPRTFSGAGPTGNVIRVRASGAVQTGNVVSAGTAILASDLSTITTQTISAPAGVGLFVRGDVTTGDIATAGTLWVGDSSQYFLVTPAYQVSNYGFSQTPTAGGATLGAVSAGLIRGSVLGDTRFTSLNSTLDTLWTTGNSTTIGGSVSGGAMTAGASLTVSAGGGIAFTDATAASSILLSASTGAIVGDTVVGDTVDLSAATGITVTSVESSGYANLGTSSGALTFDTISSGGDIFMGGGSIAGGIATAASNIVATAFAGDLTGTYNAGGDIRLNADANINASATAGGTSAEGNLFVDAGGNVLMANSAAARMFGVNAGGSATITDGTAGEDMLVRAGTTASLTNFSAGDNVDVRAAGNVTANNVRATGTGTDTRMLDYLPGSGFTINSGEGVSAVDGSDILLSAGGSIDASTLSAGDDIVLNAATTIALNGGTTLGLGITGGDSSIRTSGGDTTLANLNAFSDVAVASTGTANVTGSVRAGNDVIINANAVTLADIPSSGDPIDTIVAGRDVAITSAADISGGGALRAGRNLTLDAGGAIGITRAETGDGGEMSLVGATGIDANELYSRGVTTLSADDGDIRIGSLTSFGDVSVDANSLDIGTNGPITFANIVTDVGDATIGSNNRLIVTNAAIAGTARFEGGGEHIIIRDLTANAAQFNATEMLSMTNVSVTNSLNANAGTTIAIDGVVTGRDISLASANIDIASTGRVGTAGVTQGLTLANNDDQQQTIVGGTGTKNGYHIDADELTRLFGTNIEIFAPRVSAVGPFSVGSSASPDVIVDSFTMTGGAQGSNLGANGSLTIRTPGKMRVIGNVQLTGLSDTNALNLFANDALEVILGQGTVRLLGANNAPGGQLNMRSRDIIVATAAAIADVANATTTDAINTRLGQNDGVTLDEGALFARGISFEVDRGVYVQNSGTGTDFGLRRGLTFGAGGLNVATEGNARIVINGVQLGPNGQVTGFDTIPFLTINNRPVAGPSNLFDPRSTFNGCVIANTGSCTAVTFDPGNLFPVQDVVDNETDGDGDTGDGTSLPTALITMRDLDPLSGEPLLDDPVTGAGNDDLWTPTTDTRQP